MRIRDVSRMIAVTVLLALGACSSAPTGGGVSVTVLDNAFSPSSVTVAPGVEVSWVWSGSAAHNVVFNDGGASSEVMATGQFNRSFSAAGTYSYVCSLHSGMNGTVIVQ